MSSETHRRSIESVGVYTPRYRISSETITDAGGTFEATGVARKTVPAGDEDTVTMTVEAAERALSDGSVESADVVELHLATTTPPQESFDIGATVIELLGLPASTAVTVRTQSTNAGTRALDSAFDSDGPALVIAADATAAAPDDPIEHAAGAGAVAFLLTTGGTVDRVDGASFVEEYPGTRFRERGSDEVVSYGATAYERRAFIRPVVGAVNALDEAPSALAVTAPDGSLPSRVNRAIEHDTEVYHVADDLGDLGAASALFGLLTAWENDEPAVTVVGHGSGAGAMALSLDGSLSVTLSRQTEEIGYATYLRKRGHTLGSDGGDS